jgi:hypothetical protein
MANTFPPKFSKNILYPAVYNLDEMDIPSESDFSSPGTYFNITFANLTSNVYPELGYGKHKFTVNIIPYGDDELVTQSFGKLKGGSRILFEFKDSSKTRIFSDMMPITLNNIDNLFHGYVWIKQDPIRTYNSIQEGWGEMTIVGIAKTTDGNWRNRYNIRVKQDIDIKLFNDETIPTYESNKSPIIFQRNTGSMGSGSGLTITEVQTDGPMLSNVSNVNISASRLDTYSGEVSRVNTYIKVSGSGRPDWELVSTNTLSSSIYEDGIYKDYGQGINTLSEQWSHEVPTHLVHQTSRRVKFKLEFENSNYQIAKDPYTPTDDFVLLYPNLPESNQNGWIQWGGSQFLLGHSGNQIITNNDVITTSGGQFTFNKNIYGIPPDAGGQSFGNNGNMEQNGYTDDEYSDGGHSD